MTAPGRKITIRLAPEDQERLDRICAVSKYIRPHLVCSTLLGTALKLYERVGDDYGQFDEAVDSLFASPGAREARDHNAEMSERLDRILGDLKELEGSCHQAKNLNAEEKRVRMLARIERGGRIRAAGSCGSLEPAPTPPRAS